MSKDWVVILAITFIVFIAWLILDIYQTKPNQPAPPELQQALEPLNPTFDQNVINSLNQIKKPTGTTPETSPNQSEL